MSSVCAREAVGEGGGGLIRGYYRAISLTPEPWRGSTFNLKVALRKYIVQIQVREQSDTTYGIFLGVWTNFKGLLFCPVDMYELDGYSKNLC